MQAWSLGANWGLTPQAYDELLAAQDGVCAICRRPPGKNALSVDHDHASGRIRGLLCPPCNRSVEWMIYYGEDARSYLGSVDV